MQITINVDEGQIERMVRARVAELFSADARYREAGVRLTVNKFVDDAATEAVKEAWQNIKDKIPAMANQALTVAVNNEMTKAANRGLKMISKLFAGFDPKDLTPEQREWLTNQITKQANGEK